MNCSLKMGHSRFPTNNLVDRARLFPIGIRFDDRIYSRSIECQWRAPSCVCDHVVVHTRPTVNLQEVSVVFPTMSQSTVHSLL